MKSKLIVFTILFLTSASFLILHSQVISPETIYKNSESSILFVKSYSPDSIYLGYGSAVVVSPDGLVYSVYHLFQNTDYIKVYNDDKQIEDVKIIGIDPAKDILILKIPPQQNFIPLGNSDSIKIGETVYSLGNPKGYKKTFAAGLLSNIRKENDKWNLQYSASISGGSSGGALLNNRGELIGITASYVESGQNLNFAIPVNDLINTELIDESDSIQISLMKDLTKSNSNTSASKNDLTKLLGLFRSSAITNKTILKTVGKICSDQSLNDSAIQIYSDAISLYPADKELYLQRAKCYMFNDDSTKTENDFAKALELDSTYRDVYFWRSFYYANYVSKYKEAILDYNKYFELDPDWHYLYYERALAYLKLGDTTKALKDIQYSYDEKYDSDDTYYLRGLIYKDLKMYREAIYEFTNAIEKSKDNRLYYFQRAIAYSLNLNDGLAARDYLECIKLDYSDPTAYNNLAYSYYHLEEYDEAEKNFLKAIKLDVKHFDSYLGLSILSNRQNHIMKTKRYMTQAIKIQPELEHGMKGLDSLKKKGYFWTETEMKDLKKVFVLMGIEEPEKENLIIRNKSRAATVVSDQR